jgi:hypothetical protein
MTGELDQHIWDLGFRAWHDVADRRSVAGLFGQRNRGGVYVLGFGNGERYVGRSRDVVRRFAQHQAVHSDITLFTFRRLAAAEVADVERHCIHTLEATGMHLPNLAEMSVVSGERVFDAVVTPEEQQRWLEGEVRDVEGGARARDDDLRRRYATRFEKFMQRRYADEALQVLGTYIRTALPYPLRTELTFWSLSCLPSGLGGVYSRVNVNMQEVLTVLEDDGLWVSFHLARSPFEEQFGPRWPMYLRRNHYEWNEHQYGPGGGDQFNVWTSAEGALILLHDPVAVRAMSLLNLRLMRKGRTYYATSHCIDLVTAALERVPGRE